MIDCLLRLLAVLTFQHHFSHISKQGGEKTSADSKLSQLLSTGTTMLALLCATRAYPRPGVLGERHSKQAAAGRFGTTPQTEPVQRLKLRSPWSSSSDRGRIVLCCCCFGCKNMKRVRRHGGVNPVRQRRQKNEARFLFVSMRQIRPQIHAQSRLHQ